MLEKADPQEQVARLRFGAGVNTVASEDEAAAQEAVEGENFILDVDNTGFRPRKPFDKVAVAPNGAEIRGLAQLYKTDGSLSTLIQAGDKVYEWDGTLNGMTEIATVSSSARLRGPLSANWNLSDKVFITDLEKAEVVKEWDGTTFQDMPHNLTASDFYAKYCFVDGERAWFANVQSGTDTPHMIVGSEIEDNTNLSVSNKPSSALGTADPFYMLTPDLRPINGAINAFGNIILSSRRGKIFQVTGSSAKNFSIKKFFTGSAASGDEGLTEIGNDVLIGSVGLIDTLSGVETFGDVSTDDATRVISNVITDFDEWIIVYNHRYQRVYCFPKEQNVCWVFFKPVFDDLVRRVRQRQTTETISPWSKWTTQHDAGFQPEVAMNMYDPGTKRMETFFGDSSGNLYMFEGEGDGDGGTEDITAFRRSPIIRTPNNEAWDINGWISYRKRLESYNVKLRVIFSGNTVSETEIDFTVPSATIDGSAFYGSPEDAESGYYSDDAYYGSSGLDKIWTQIWSAAGQSSQFQIELEVKTKVDFSISEVGVRFTG